jgi:hypothetical protein
MEVLFYLINVNNSTELQSYIEQNHAKIIDSLSQSNHLELIENKSDFKRLSLNVNVFNSLDFEKIENVAIINVILNTAIRLGDKFTFERFYYILKTKNLGISSLIEAASYYMIEANTFEALNDQIFAIHDKLDEAFKNEEDNNKNVIAVLINYYQFFVYNFLEFAPENVIGVNTKIKEIKESKVYFFNQDDIIDNILAVELVLEDDPYTKIHILTDEFLCLRSIFGDIENTILIEKNSDYEIELGDHPYTFNRIYTINKTRYLPIQNDQIFHSLQRGVKVPDELDQLYCYIYAYGKMHYVKLDDALKNINVNFEKHRLIDWGCGQGIGSLTYLEQLDKLNLGNLCESVLLIEPSEIAIKRAALHIKGRVKRTYTCNKDIDSLVDDDLLINKEACTVHIFSNILDVELFSLQYLIDIVNRNCIGRNYFIITSPYINQTRLARINIFVNSFRNNDGFEMHYASDAPSGSWINGWSKAIRVYKANIQ